MAECRAVNRTRALLLGGGARLGPGGTALRLPSVRSRLPPTAPRRAEGPSPSPPTSAAAVGRAGEDLPQLYNASKAARQTAAGQGARRASRPFVAGGGSRSASAARATVIKRKNRLRGQETATQRRPREAELAKKLLKPGSTASSPSTRPPPPQQADSKEVALVPPHAIPTSTPATATAVSLFNRLLAGEATSRPTAASYDDATERAVMAFRKVNNMPAHLQRHPRDLQEAGRRQGRLRAEAPGRRAATSRSTSPARSWSLADNGKAKHIFHVSTGAPSTPSDRGTFRFYRKGQPGYNSLGHVLLGLLQPRRGDARLPLGAAVQRQPRLHPQPDPDSGSSTTGSSSGSRSSSTMTLRAVAELEAARRRCSPSSASTARASARSRWLERQEAELLRRRQAARCCAPPASAPPAS